MRNIERSSIVENIRTDPIVDISAVTDDGVRESGDAISPNFDAIPVSGCGVGGDSVGVAAYRVVIKRGEIYFVGCRSLRVVFSEEEFCGVSGDVGNEFKFLMLEKHFPFLRFFQSDGL